MTLLIGQNIELVPDAAAADTGLLIKESSRYCTCTSKGFDRDCNHALYYAIRGLRQGLRGGRGGLPME